MKTYQIVIIVVIFITVGCFLGSKVFASNKLFGLLPNNNSNSNASIAGKIDLWCENGKYYKRTTTSVYGISDNKELTKDEFDALVLQGISYSGNCI